MREIKPIKLAMLSCTHGHAKAYYSLRNDPYYELVGCSIEEGYKGKPSLKALDGIPLYDSDEELYAAHPEIEAVIIASANVKHYQQFVEAAKRGLHIYSMKIPTFNMDEYESMIALAKENNVVCQVELEMRHHTEVSRVKELINTGAIGELLSINLLNYSHNPVWWRPWQCDPVDSFGERVRISPDSPLYRGGALADHPHIFDVVRLITGSEFDTVYAEVAPNIRDIETEDLIRIIGKLKNGVIVSLDPSYANNEHKVKQQVNWEKYPRCVEVTMNAVGTKGVIFSDLYGRAYYCQRDEGGYYLSGGPSPVGMWNRRMQEFYESVRHGMPISISLEDHYNTIKTMVTAYNSVYEGKPLKVD